MVDSEYTPDNYESWINKKNSEILRFVPDHLKARKMRKHAVKKLPFLITYVSDRHKTQEMCDRTILENEGTLRSVLDCCKNQKMCNKTANYAHTLEFVSDC